MNVILKLATKGSKKTHIMYQANLSHSQLNKYLRILEERRLIKETVQGYVTTEVGSEFIKKFQEIQDLMGEPRISNPGLFPR
jgi:predicted transcriptional regulator